MNYRPTIQERLAEKTIIGEEPDDCWLWQGSTNNGGYGMICHTRNGKRLMRTTHRVSAELSGMDIEGKCVLHKCDTPNCINPNHLRTGTHTDNMRDMRNKGRGSTARRSGPRTEAHKAKIAESLKKYHRSKHKEHT